MPKSKTIEIDEIVTPDKPSGDDDSGREGWSQSTTKSAGKRTQTDPSDPEFSSGDPFADFHKALPWKARLTLKLTSWFILLRSTSWGKFVIIPIIILGVLLVIPLGLIAIFLLMLRSIFFPRRH